MSGSKTSLQLGIPDIKAWSDVVYLYCGIEISNEVHEIGTGWSGEIRSITFAADSSTVSVVYRVTIRGSDGEAWRESSGTASVSDTQFGDPVQKAEGMAFRRACARFGLGLYLYHEEEAL
jgi:hypothetical protein